MLLEMEPPQELDVFEQRKIAAMAFGNEQQLPMLNWLRQATENSAIHARMELPSTRRKISRIISNYASSAFYRQFEEGIAERQSLTRRTESALQVAERQVDCPIAGYYSRAHPEIGPYFGEDWGADHADNLRRTAAAQGHIISDPGSFYLEIIAPELISCWIMEDLQIEREAASGILSSPLATAYGRLVLEDEYVQKQEPYDSLAHSGTWGLVRTSGAGWKGRRRQQPNRL